MSYKTKTQNWKTASDWSVLHERKWFFVSADVSGGGTRDEALRTSGWLATCSYSYDDMKVAWRQGNRSPRQALHIELQERLVMKVVYLGSYTRCHTVLSSDLM